jgi:hypothetical protein
MGIQIGDEVEFDALGADCAVCEAFAPVIYPDSHFVSMSGGMDAVLICDSCADTEDKRQIPVRLIKPIIENEPLGPPKPGAFRPIQVEPTHQDAPAHDYWMSMGHMILEVMATWQDKVLKFSLGGNRYKGIWIKPHWNGPVVASISLAGDTPSKKLELDVYQVSRLRKLGFTETGSTNKFWQLDLEPDEGDVLNSSAIVLYTIRHGYLLEPSDLYSITPTIDADFSDPEYSELGKGGRVED